MVNAMDDFADGLRAAMAAQGVGVRALARRVNCDPGLISRLASGKQDPSPKMAALLSAALGVPALASTRPAGRPGAEMNESGLLVPSNYWRAAEVILIVENGGAAAAELHAAYAEYCPATAGALPAKRG
jgi:transcriptional regulator with XRE-family HTH domain